MNKRLLVLIATPKEKLGELKSLFTNEEGSIKRKLENPPLNAGQLRYGGWDLRTLDQGKIIDAQFVRVQNGDRKIIDLYNDGTLIFTGLADDDFLAHASQDGLRINSVALVELVYNFISFYKEVINDLSVIPNSISMQFRFLNMHLNNEKSYLVPGKADDISPYKYDAPSDDLFSRESLDFRVEDFNKEKIGEMAYKLLEKIYLCFSVPLDAGNIPYIKVENLAISVDIEAIKNL